MGYTSCYDLKMCRVMLGLNERRFRLSQLKLRPLFHSSQAQCHAVRLSTVELAIRKKQYFHCGIVNSSGAKFHVHLFSIVMFLCVAFLKVARRRECPIITLTPNHTYVQVEVARFLKGSASYGTSFVQCHYYRQAPFDPTRVLHKSDSRYSLPSK